MKRGLYVAMGGVVLAAVITAIGAAQVFPIRWQEEPLPNTVMGAPGALVMGNGVLALNPDLVINQEPFGGTTGGKKVIDASCSAANRGEIRIINLFVDLEGGRNFDALCFCQQSVVDGGAPNYWWACLKIQ